MRLSTKVLPFVGVPLLVILMLVALLAWFSGHAREKENLDTLSDQRVLTAESVHSLLSEALAAERGYLATGKSEFLGPFRAAIYRLPVLAMHLVALSEDDPKQHARAIDIGRRVSERVALLSRGVSQATTGRREEVVARLATLLGEHSVRSITDGLDAFVEGETAKQQAYRIQVTDAWWDLTLSLIVFAVIATLVSLGFALFFARTIARRLEVLGIAAKRASAGQEPDVPDASGDELGDLGRTLHTMALEIREKNTVLKRYALLAEITSDALIFIDRDTFRIIDGNKAALDMYRYSRQEFMELSLGDIRASGQHDEIPQMLALADREGGVLLESIALRSDGTSFPIEVSVRSDLSEGRRVAIASIRDISQRLQTNLDLSHALKQAVDAVAVKSEFVATVSHEIRTPLNGIIGMSELLLRSRLERDQQESAQTMHDSAIALLRIINDILDFSKLEAGHVQLETMDFQVAPLVEGVVELISRSSQRELVTMMAYVSPDVPAMLRGDPGRLRQILLNLVGNAAKFTAVGSVLLSVDAVGSRSGGVGVQFSVVDTGVGMAPEVQARLFKPFSQGDASTARHFGGTGLGLVIAKAYVELMGGEIGLESRVNVGTRVSFAVAFELAEDDLPHPDLRTLGDIRLLIVDDDPAARQLLERYAEDWKLAHSSAVNGAEALAKLRAAAAAGEPFDGAIIDYQMPGLSGLDLGLEIKKDPSIAQTRLMMLTGYDDEGRAQSARASGFSAYLLKPIVQSHVFDQLLTMMDKEALGAEPASATAPRETATLGLGRRLRVLVAEDNPVNRRVATRQLALLDCDVVMVENGMEAVEAMERAHFDVVLMDCNMPVLDGFAATRRIRASEGVNGRAKTRIVAMTANASEHDREQCADAGMDDYISKPVMIEQLREVLLRGDALLTALVPIPTDRKV